MKILITGICGFAGSSIAKALLHSHTDLSILGLDNFTRRGSEINVLNLRSLRLILYEEISVLNLILMAYPKSTGLLIVLQSICTCRPRRKIIK